MKGRWEKYRKKNYNASVKKKEVKNNEQNEKIVKQLVEGICRVLWLNVSLWNVLQIGQRKKTNYEPYRESKKARYHEIKSCILAKRCSSFFVEKLTEDKRIELQDSIP